MSRTSKEYIIMAMAFGAAFAISPFATMRIIKSEWIIALVDSSLVLGFLILGVYVYLTRKTQYTAIILSILSLGGMCTVIYIKGPSLIYWAYPTMVGMYFVLAPRTAVFLCLLAAAILAPLLAKHLETSMFMAIVMTLMVNNAFAYIFAMGQIRQRDQLALLVRTDPLTNAGNRRAFDEKLDDVIANVKRSLQPISLVLIDVDHFKRINDNFGHAAGDKVLVNLVKLINARIRETDTMYRLGGEEFVVLLTGADLMSAERISEEIRLLIESAEWLDAQKITISLGTAEYISGETASNWLTRADTALYEAKNSGRNKVCLAK
ncbi:MAG: GGDEF domain-containing protein [Gammaproteobacteria bacterium]|nr:GGDEF domain-containing protein [Gammaproteobacteria bacterium]